MAAAADTPALSPVVPLDKPGSLSQWALIRRRFEQHRLAVVSLYLLAVLEALPSRRSRVA